MFEKYLFVFDMANNHMGDFDHAIKIISEIAKVVEQYRDKFLFAFKLQYRDLNTFIHPDFKHKFDIKYVKRFSETKLSWEQFKDIKNFIKEKKFLAISTPFDENSVQKVIEHDFDIIKIASCSFTDWLLLEKIVEFDKPIIASTAGVDTENIERVVKFFKHRNKKFALMHCVAQYPTPYSGLELNQIDYLMNCFPDIPVGYSTHELPDNFFSVMIAIAKGAKIFEKHVGIKTEQYSLNNYSATPEQIAKWLGHASMAIDMCGIGENRYSFGEDEVKTLKSLQRGAFAKKNIKKGEQIVPDDLFFAIPCSENQITANDFSKYAHITAKKDIPSNGAITADNTIYTHNFTKILDIVKKIVLLIKKTGVTIPKNTELELSHHYGIDKFFLFGLAMLTVINREYCKKLLILLPGQRHPEQYHIKKEETFHILYGDIDLILNGEKHCFNTGDVITIEPKTKHEIFSENGAIIEELSFTHCTDDSYYSDKSINMNKNRKTFIPYWQDV
jgi:sialic acid synthase SpsE/mannose-6-phosphate isomerase-like protein (cupin superfamily)